MQAEHDVLALFAERQAVAQFGAGEHGAGRIDAHVFGRLHRQRPEFVQAHVHLVGDVAEVAAAAGGAAVVHLEALDDAILVHLDRLGVLTADVEHGSRARVHHVRTQAMAQDFRADVLLGERQASAPVAGADHVAFLEWGIEHALDRCADGVRAAGGFGHALECPLQRAHQVGGHGVGVDAILDFDDRAVEDVEHHVVADAHFLGNSLADGEVAAAGDVAEKIRLALCARREQVRRLRLQAFEHFGQRGGDRRGIVAEARAFGGTAAGDLQVGELFQELLQAEVAFQVAEKILEHAAERT